MNGLIITAGVLATMTTAGHFAVGVKEFLKPMISADFEEIPKQVMHSVFHYISVYLILSAASLLAVGFGYFSLPQSMLLVQFIAANYALFAIWQLVIAIRSTIPKGPTKLFQWVFFVLISGFSLAGIYL